MPIQWRKQMSVGNLIIDLDHRILICMINMVEYALKEPDDLTQLRDAFDQLADYAREHFEREERIQYKVGYRHYMDHKQAHQKLLARLDEVVSDIEAMKSTAELSKKSASIVQLLRDWLLDHVLKEDMKMKPELEISPPNLL